MGKLTPKRAKFVKEYLIDLNQTHAAIRAGFSVDSAHTEGHRLLSDAEVKEAITIEQAKLSRRTEVTQEQVIRQLSLVAFSNLEDYTRLEGQTRVLDLRACDRDKLAAIQELTEDTTGGSGDGERKQVLRTKFRLSDRVKALELLSRHLGMLHDKTEHSGEISFAGKSTEELLALRDELKRKNG